MTLNQRKILSRLSQLVKAGSQEPLLINPKTMELFMFEAPANSYGYSSVTTYDLYYRRSGSAYYDYAYSNNSSIDLNEIPALISGYPRVHTSNVVEEGSGQGVVLYSASALCAERSTKKNSDIFGSGLGGVSSYKSDRSSEADRWWDKAVNRGFAKRTLATSFPSFDHVFQMLVDNNDGYSDYVFKRFFKSGSLMIDTLEAKDVIRSGLLLRDSSGNPVNSKMNVWLSLNGLHIANTTWRDSIIRSFKKLDPSEQQLKKFKKKFDRDPD